MPSLTITPSGGSPLTYSEPTDSFMGTTGAYYVSGGLAQDAQFAIETPDAPAVDGVAVRRHGFRRRDIEEIEICYINTTPQNCNNAYAADHDDMKNVTLSVAIPDDATYPACELIAFRKIGRPRATGHGKYRLHCVMQVRQMRQS